MSGLEYQVLRQTWDASTVTLAKTEAIKSGLNSLVRNKRPIGPTMAGDPTLYPNLMLNRKPYQSLKKLITRETAKNYNFAGSILIEILY